MTKGTRLVCIWTMASLAAGLCGLPKTQGQSVDSPEQKRKVRVIVKPDFPALARQLKLAGAVKIEVTIGPDGKVKRTRVVGGHPVLAKEAEKAAQQTEFEPGPRETVEILEFKFSIGN